MGDQFSDQSAVLSLWPSENFEYLEPTWEQSLVFPTHPENSAELTEPAGSM